MKHKVYYANGDSTTKVAIQKYVAENQDKEIVMVDEIDKMSAKYREGLVNMMEPGQFTITKV